MPPCPLHSVTRTHPRGAITDFVDAKKSAEQLSVSFDVALSPGVREVEDDGTVLQGQGHQSRLRFQFSSVHLV